MALSNPDNSLEANLDANVSEPVALTAPAGLLMKAKVIFKFTRVALHILLGITLIILMGFWITHKFSFQKKTKQWWLRKICDIVGVQVKVNGHYQFKPALLISNHISWLDIAVIGGQIPTRFLAKAEVRSWPVIGWLAASTGTLFIKRGGGQSAQISSLISDEIAAGHPILVFPEATSTDGREVKRFFPNLFAAPLAAKSYVQPVAIRYLENGKLSKNAPFIGDDEFVSHLSRLMRTPGITVELNILDPIAPGLAEGKRELSNLSRAAVIESLAG